MADSVSSTTICSNALVQLGDKPLQSLAEDNDRARTARELYPTKRDKVLRAHPWNCATKRTILSPDPNPPAFGWGYKFLLPADYLRVISVGVDENSPDDYTLEGRYILMDRNACYLRYVWKNYDEASWDATLVDAMTQVMMVAITYPQTMSTSKQDLELAAIREVLKQARAIDAQENPSEQIGTFPLLQSRLG